MKTIAIFSGYHLPHLGGIERYTNNLSKELVKQGYKVVIVSSNYQFDNEYKKEEKGITYYKIPVYKLFVSRYPIPKRDKNYKYVLEELNKLNIDRIIVNTRFHLTSLVGAKYGYKHNIPVYQIEHGSQHLTVDNKVLDFFGRIYEHCLTSYIKHFTDYYYAVSKEACNWQKHFNIESNGVWYNSIYDFSKSYNIKKNEKEITILYAGRILKQKGIIELLDAFEILNKKYNNVKLNIAGDGNILTELKKKYKNKNIKFLGKLDFDNLCKEYAKTNIFVYAPNWPEGLPTSVLEAGLMECCCISSPQGGNKEIIIDNKTGLMINNTDELVSALEKLINNKKLREELSTNLKKKILKEFIWENTAKKIIGDLNENK